MKTIYVLGSSPCIQDLDIDLLKNKTTIAVNLTFFLRHWFTCVWFNDNHSMFNLFHEPLLAYPGELMTIDWHETWETDPNLIKLKPIRHIDRQFTKSFEKPFGLCTDENCVSSNDNSGLSAVNVAYHLGAERVVLLGMALGPINGREYAGTKELSKVKLGHVWDRYAPIHGYVKQVADDAGKIGLEVLNASLFDHSKVFPRVKFKDVL